MAEERKEEEEQAREEELRKQMEELKLKEEEVWRNTERSLLQQKNELFVSSVHPFLSVSRLT